MGDYPGHPFRGNQWTAGSDAGFINDGKTYRVFHGTTATAAEAIRKTALKKPEQTGEASWYMVTTSINVARDEAKKYSGATVIEYHIPAEELKATLWKGVLHGDTVAKGHVQHGLRGGKLDSKFIAKIHSPWSKPKDASKQRDKLGNQIQKALRTGGSVKLPSDPFEGFRK